MLILVSIGIIVFGLIIKRYYHKGILHNSIYKPIMVIGGLLLLISTIGEVQKHYSTQIYNLTEEQVEKIEVIGSYDFPIISPSVIYKGDKRIAIMLASLKKKLLIDNFSSNTIGYIDIQISMTSGENLYAVLYKTEDGFFFSQVHRYLFLPFPGKLYIVSDSIELVF
ncbi:MAG: hypothetical protein ABFS32_12675 [Bacteroidota bacterium]